MQDTGPQLLRILYSEEAVTIWYMLGCYRRGYRCFPEKGSHTQPRSFRRKWLQTHILNDKYIQFPLRIILTSYTFLEGVTWIYYLVTIRFPNWQLMVKNLSANTGDIRDTGSLPGSVRSSGGGHGMGPVFLPGDPLDRGAWWAIVHWVTKSWTWLKQLSTQSNYQLLL